MHKMFVKNAVALTALVVASPMVLAQQGSNVQLYGIVDAAIRHTNNEGAGGDSSLTKMIGGGMSQSRWGINVTEDLGGGLKAIANLESRLELDSGSLPANAPYFQQSWMGLQGNAGRLTMGRQYNVLFDLVTTTYSSFPYSPYMEAYKPEIGMALGARSNNMLKYTAEVGAIRGALQYSFDEGAPGRSGRTVGGYLRYSADGLSVGGAYQNLKLFNTAEMDAMTVGGSYRSGPLYVNLGYGRNKIKGHPGEVQAANAGIAAMWSGEVNGGFLRGAATKRDMVKIGFGYQFTPQVNAGVHYYHAKQSGSPVAADNGKAHFLVAVADYAFSKRTDAYFGVDHTKVKGGANLALGTNGARDRTGITAGIRHRF